MSGAMQMNAVAVDEPKLAHPIAPNRSRRIARLPQFLGRRPGFAAFAIYALLAWLADFPIWPGDPHQVPTEVGGDIVQTAWFLEWTPWAILHGHNPFFSNSINFPQGVDIAQNTGIQLLALLSAPLTLWVSPVASENLLRFLAFTLSAYAAFWVLRRWTDYLPAAFIGGLIYGFSPYMVSQGEFHLNLTFVPFPPLILYALFELLVAQQHSSRRWGLLLGVCAVCQFYVSAEVLATTGLVAAIGAFYLFFLGFRFVRGKYRHALVGLLLAAAVIAPLIGYPVIEMLHGPAHYTGPAQGFHNVYNADLLGPLLPTKDMLVAPARLSQIGTRLVGAQIQENGSYLGLPLIALTAFFALRYWRRLWPLFLVLMAGTAFVLSLGPTLVIDGKHHVLPVDLPFGKIDHLPVIDNILPVRFSLYVAFFVAVLAALGIDALHAEILRHRAAAPTRATTRRAATPSHVFGAVIALVSLVSLVPRWPYRTVAVSIGVHYSETAAGLRVVPKNATVLAYPYPTSFFDLPMFWQALDHMNFKLLGSYALVPGRHDAATLFPEVLQPMDVEAMLVNSVTAVPDPDLPDLVATAQSIDARQVRVLPAGTKTHGTSPVAGVLVGRIGSIAHRARLIYVFPNRFTPIAVHFAATTSYIEPGVPRPSIKGLVPGEIVQVTGPVGPGTINAQMVQELRSYLQGNHVDAVVLGLGVTDATEIVKWFRAAIGRPTQAGGGAEIWANVPAQLRRTASA